MEVVMTNFVRLEDTAIRDEKAKAAELLRCFIKEKLAGNLSNWLNFDCFSLNDMAEYGCPDRAFDCDDSELMRAVYVLLWADDFPELSFENLGTGRLYRGDLVPCVSERAIDVPERYKNTIGGDVTTLPGFWSGVFIQEK